MCYVAYMTMQIIIKITLNLSKICFILVEFSPLPTFFNHVSKQLRLTLFCLAICRPGTHPKR